MKGADREERDARILQLFIGGGSYRMILATLRADVADGEAQGEPRPTGWALRSTADIHRVVQKALSESAQRRALLTDEAYAMHQERTEQLFAAHWATALDPSKDGAHRSGELCRRILAQQGKQLYGLGESTSLPAPTQPLAGERDDDEEEQDELAKLRAARES